MRRKKVPLVLVEEKGFSWWFQLVLSFEMFLFRKIFMRFILRRL